MLAGTASERLAGLESGFGKRDLPCNITMNVPVTPEGRLTFEDGISAPGRYVEMRAETNLLCLISTAHKSTTATPTTPPRFRYLSGKSMAFFKRIPIANRGEIAVRIIHTAKNGFGNVAVFSIHRGAPHVRLADFAIASETPRLIKVIW